MDFKSFPKIPRYTNELVTITEKIDGTNGLIGIWEDEHGIKHIRAGSRNRWLDEKNNNFKFYQFVMDNAVELIEKLGTGYHYGEWYGQGIQRHYGLKERRFALFNIKVWADDQKRPKCCEIVPILYEGPWYDGLIRATQQELEWGGTFIQGANIEVPPEGIMILMPSLGKYYKYIMSE
jgi:hypothetical protein